MTDTTQDDLAKQADAFRLGSRPTDVDVDKANWLIDRMSARIDALTAERDALKEAVDEVTEYAKRHEAERDELAEKLDIAIKGLEQSREEIDDYIRWEYPSDHPVHERYRKRDFAANPARATLAELKRSITADDKSDA